MSILGNRIKQERENLGLTREDFAKKIGVSYSAIAMYEQGNREPNNELLLKICNIFNCSTDYLMGKSYYRNYEDYQKTNKFVLENVKNLNSEEVSEIARLLNYINRNDIKDVDDFINNEISNFNSNNKLTMIKITSHLHYRYHGKIPENFTTKNIINETSSNDEVTAQEWTNENKYIATTNSDGSISYSEKFYMTPVYRSNLSRTT